MYGEQCPAIITDDSEQLMVDITCFIYDCDEFEDREYELTDILRNCHRDSMGMKSVVYWPQVKWVDDDSSDEDEDEE